MIPGDYPFTIYQGATWSRSMTLSIGGVVVDLHDYSARMTIRRTYGAPPILSLTSAPNGGIVLSAASPTPNIYIEISATKTAALSFVTAVGDFELIAPDGVVVDRLFSGVVTLSTEVTT